MNREKPWWAKALANKNVQRVIALGFLGVAVWFVGSTLDASRHADACAKRLVAAVGRDAAFVHAAVKNPSQRARLEHAKSATLEFVRPLSTQWIRVGIVVDSVKTSTVPPLVRLILDAQNTEECVFLLDYED